MSKRKLKRVEPQHPETKGAESSSLPNPCDSCDSLAPERATPRTSDSPAQLSGADPLHQRAPNERLPESSPGVPQGVSACPTPCHQPAQLHQLPSARTSDSLSIRDRLQIEFPHTKPVPTPTLAPRTTIKPVPQQWRWK